MRQWGRQRGSQCRQGGGAGRQGVGAVSEVLEIGRVVELGEEADEPAARGEGCAAEGRHVAAQLGRAHAAEREAVRDGRGTVAGRVRDGLQRGEAAAERAAVRLSEGS